MSLMIYCAKIETDLDGKVLINYRGRKVIQRWLGLTREICSSITASLLKIQRLAKELLKAKRRKVRGGGYLQLLHGRLVCRVLPDIVLPKEKLQFVLCNLLFDSKYFLWLLKK